MPPRSQPQPLPTANRWSPGITERAEVAAAWIEAERKAGRPHGDDEVWAFVTESWQGIPTNDAELVLNVAMTLSDARDREPGRTQVDAAVLDALRSVCDGTYGSDNPKDWTLEAGPGRHMDMAEVYGALCEAVHAALRPGHADDDPGIAPPAP